jgi:hypothetical protein
LPESSNLIPFSYKISGGFIKASPTSPGPGNETDCTTAALLRLKSGLLDKIRLINGPFFSLKGYHTRLSEHPFYMSTAGVVWGAGRVFTGQSGGHVTRHMKITTHIQTRNLKRGMVQPRGSSAPASKPEAGPVPHTLHPKPSTLTPNLETINPSVLTT